MFLNTAVLFLKIAKISLFWVGVFSRLILSAGGRKICLPLPPPSPRALIEKFYIWVKLSPIFYFWFRVDYVITRGLIGEKSIFFLKIGPFFQ